MAKTTEIVKFANAGLPSANVGSFVHQLQQARDVVSVSSGTPFLKLGKEDGVWLYGQEDTEIEEGSEWAINPHSMQIGVIAWPPAKSSLKEPIKKMRAVLDRTTPPIDVTNLPDPANGGVWDICVAFQLQCIGGSGPKGEKIEDVGVVIEYQQNSHGGKNAFDAISAAMIAQASTDAARIVPVVLLESSSYEHPKWGTVYKPEFTIIRWIGMDGSAAPAQVEQQEEEAPAANDPAEQPTPKAAAAGRRGRGAAAAAEPAAEPAAQPGVVRRRRRA